MTQGKFAKLFILFGMIIFTILNTSCNQHTHSFMIKTNDEQHYHECECGKTKYSALHTFELKKDEEQHYYECECGSIKEESAHKFSWIIDQNLTIEKEGIKHQECEICNLKKDENTNINKLVPTGTEERPVNIFLNNVQSHQYDELDELTITLESNEEFLNKQFYVLDKNKVIFEESRSQIKYTTFFKAENSNEEYEPCIRVYAFIHSNISTYNDKNGCSSQLYVSLKMYFFGIDLDTELNNISYGCYTYYTYDMELEEVIYI